ncbi:MAG TPA: malto-oligosyltrehalose synthase [Bacteroidota bacterium]
MRFPAATYRLQMHSGFTFLQAKAAVHYLSLLGISDLYLSPIFRSRGGSTHGYDVLDPTQVNPELGGREGLNALAAEARSHNLGILLDIVPNHMAFDSENAMLMDVFEKGQESRFFRFFDMDWNHPYENMRGRILAPILGTRSGEALERREIKLAYGPGGFTFNYFQQHFSLRLQSYATVLTLHLGALRRKLGVDHPDFIKFLGVLYTLKNLPAGAETNGELYEQSMFVKRMLWELYQSNAEIRNFVDGNVGIFNALDGKSDGLVLLNNLLGEQLFRLAYWKVATEELNYRRFFTINDLISLRQEDEEVQRQTHTLVMELVTAGVVTGLRIDHIDGLYDPLLYLQRLRQSAGDLYVVVEKILAADEDLPSDWPVQGTTGYDFLNAVNGLLCNKPAAAAMTDLYQKFIGQRVRFQEMVSERKRMIIGKHMAGDIDNLAHLIKRITSKDRHGSDFTLYGLRRALVETMTFFPVYRSYVRPESYTRTDCDYLKHAVERARGHNPDLLDELEFIEDFLLLRFRDYISEEEKKDWVHFVMRFQQFTGPLMAKGFEDTMLYVYNRLTSLNEVGSEPDRFGFTPEEFHAFNRHRAAAWPHALNATATHDTKRGEDVRARLNVLSENPREWQRALLRWARMNKDRKARGGMPDRNDEYLLYQTLVGTFPFDASGYEEYVRRICDYMIKAVREAKTHTTWLKPDKDYETALLEFMGAVLRDGDANPFLADLKVFSRRIAHFGIFNSLSQVLLKMTSPGVADFYQGSELWDLSLVDPDNRRPVDYALRERYLEDIRRDEQRDPAQLLRSLLSTRDDGRIKLYTVYRVLRARNDRKELFTEGTYEPLPAGGSHAANVTAFVRHYGRQWAVPVAPRLCTQLVNENTIPAGNPVWGDTTLRLPEGPAVWAEVLSGTRHAAGELRVGDLLAEFPLALLVGEQQETVPATG